MQVSRGAEAFPGAPHARRPRPAGRRLPLPPRGGAPVPRCRGWPRRGGGVGAASPACPLFPRAAGSAGPCWAGVAEGAPRLLAAAAGSAAWAGGTPRAERGGPGKRGRRQSRCGPGGGRKGLGAAFPMPFWRCVRRPCGFLVGGPATPWQVLWRGGAFLCCQQDLR